MIHSISCLGYRGFSTRQILNLAIPNGTPGSGLTVLVGPNGGGKSSIVECFNKISLARKNVSFSKGKRNLRAGDLVEIAITSDEGQGTLRTSKGGSETTWAGPTLPKVYYLPSRRFFNPYFSKTLWTRDIYLNNPPSFQTRTNPLDSCTYRLIELNNSDSSAFDKVMERVLGKPLQWTIQHTAPICCLWNPYLMVVLCHVFSSHQMVLRYVLLTKGQGSSYHLLAIISTTRISWEQMQGLVSLRKII